MKIAYVVSLFPCWSETFILREIQELARRGIDVRIFSLRRACEKLVQPDALPFLDLVEYPSAAGSIRSTLRWLCRRPVALARLAARLVIGMWRTPAMLAKSLAMIPRTLRILDLLREGGFDHLHAHWATYPATAAWIASRLDGRAYSFTAHAHDIWLGKPLLGEKIERARFVAAISEFNRRYLLPYAGRHPDRIKVIHCGLDLARFPFGDRPETRPARILSAGRLDEIKGFPHLIDACAELVRRGVPFEARIIGEGPLRASLEAQIRDRGLAGRVALAPALPQPELLREIQASSLFVLPSVRTPRGNQDGIPVVLMEAMALGVPVVSTRVAGIPELIQDGVSGLLVEPGDGGALATAMGSLLAEPHAGRRLARAGRQAVEDGFTISGNVDRLLGEIGVPAAGRSAPRTIQLDRSYIS